MEQPGVFFPQGLYIWNAQDLVELEVPQIAQQVWAHGAATECTKFFHFMKQRCSRDANGH
ncbi:hypothetical protein D3C78_1900050 [compost metagenome]